MFFTHLSKFSQIGLNRAITMAGPPTLKRRYMKNLRRMWNVEILIGMRDQHFETPLLKYIIIFIFYI